MSAGQSCTPPRARPRPACPANAAAPQVRAEWACAEKGGSQSTCEALTALAEARAVALLVVGSFGRKGEKSFDMLVGGVGLGQG